jgi:dCTP deaminase
MSIMSDIWIRRQCTPTEALLEGLQDQSIAREHSPGKFHRSTLNRAADREALVIERVNWKGPMIEPFFPTTQRTRRVVRGGEITEDKCLSFGLSAYGYDVRLQPKFKVFTNTIAREIDPHNFDDKCFVDVLADEVMIPPNGFILGLTMEYIRVPRDILVTCVGKSTLARCGANVIVTPLEPEWEGYTVIEIGNLTSLPIKIRAGEGVAQFLFLKGNEPCETSYADKAGKYQGQKDLVVAKL